MERKIPEIEKLDNILNCVEDIPTNCNNFLSAVNSQLHLSDLKNKSVSFSVNKQFKPNEQKLFINDEGKYYFEVELSSDTDIISNIDVGSSYCNSFLKVNSTLYNSNKRIVHCASIYTPIKLIIILNNIENIENTVFLYWKATCLLDTELKKRIMYSNLECDGIRYFQGVVIN